MDSRSNDTPAEELAMILKAQAGDQAAKVWLLDTYRPLIIRIAKRLRCHGTENEDRFQMVRLAFLKAIDAYDESRPVKFCTFAHIAVRNSSFGQALPYERLTKLKLVENFDLQPGHEDRTIEQRAAQSIVAKLLIKLPPDEAIALRGIMEERTLWEIADQLDVSKQRADQIRISAFRRAVRWLSNRLEVLE